MNTAEINKQAAATILSQLGGRRFLAFTGAKNLLYSSQSNAPCLSMRIGRNKAGFNYLKITLNSMDLYDMYFSRFSTNKDTGAMVVHKEITYNNLYSDQLQPIFTEATGLLTNF